MAIEIEIDLFRLKFLVKQNIKKEIYISIESRVYKD